jgi:hypothetical protein
LAIYHSLKERENLYTINNEKFYPSNGLEILLKQIKTYLYENQLILAGSNGDSLTETEIINIIAVNPTYSFNTISVSEVENGFINEMLDYVEKVEKYFTQLSDSNDNEFIINTFIDLINSLTEIVKVAEHYKVNFLSIENINEIANKAISRIEIGDIDFLLDVMEYEIIPSLHDFKSKLLERQNH